MQDLPQAATDIERDIEEIMYIISKDEETNVDGLPLRELLGLDKTLPTTRGELVNNLAKLSKIDEEIKNLQDLYASARDRDDEDVEVSEELRKQLRDKQDERSARLEVASTNERVLRSQINRIKETINRMLEKDVTLREKI